MDKIFVGLLFFFLFLFSVSGLLFYYSMCNCVRVPHLILYDEILKGEAQEREIVRPGERE